MYLFTYFLKPNVLIQKDNDLGRNSIPFYLLIRNSIRENHSLPLWRSDQMIGESIIANPASTLTYPFNILLIIFPLGLFLLTYYLFHLALSAVSTYFLARSFSISKYSAFICAIFYTFSTKSLLHFSAGHITMVAAMSFFPLAFLATRNILYGKKDIWILILAISLSFILNLFATVFYYAILFLVIYVIYYLFFKSPFKVNLPTKIKLLCVFLSTILLCLCFSAIFLLPLLEFGSISSRSQLTLDDVALPLWNLKKLISSLSMPYLNFKDLDHESFLYLGIAPIVLMFIGYLHLSKQRKIIIAFFAVIAILFAAGLSTPLFKVAYDYLPFLKYSRVTTRFWFVIALVAALLSGVALDKIKNMKLTILLVSFFILETSFISYLKTFTIPNLDFSNLKIYQYIASDKDTFRVYCTTYCFNPQLASKYNLQMLNGENPIQNSSYINFLQKAGNFQFNKFAVIFPPYQVWQVNIPPQPNSELLGEANVKYIASTYLLNNQDFIFVEKYNEIYLYKNTKYKKRAYFKDSDETIIIEKYNPNNLILTYSKLESAKELIVSDLYYPGWQAYSDEKKLKVEKDDQIFRKILVPKLSNRVELKFEPTSFLVGKAITMSTILFILIYIWYKKRQ